MVESVAESADSAVGSSIEARELFPWIQSPSMLHCEMLITVDVDAVIGMAEEGGLISISIIWKSSVSSRGLPFCLRFLGILLQTERDKRNNFQTVVGLTGLSQMRVRFKTVDESVVVI